MEEKERDIESLYFNGKGVEESLIVSKSIRLGVEGVRKGNRGHSAYKLSLYLRFGPSYRIVLRASEHADKASSTADSRSSHLRSNSDLWVPSYVRRSQARRHNVLL